MNFWYNVARAIKKCDIIVEVLDARMPELSRNRDLEKIVDRNDKILLFALNKSDLINFEDAERIKIQLGKDRCVFVSGKKNLGMKRLKETLFIKGKQSGFEMPHVLFVGYPNVGKSSVINALAKKGTPAKVSPTAGTTRGVQWIRLGDLFILDSPGVIPFEEKNEAVLAILGAKDPHRLKNPELASIELIRLFLSRKLSTIDSLRRFYKIKAEGDEYEIFEEIGKKRGFLLKKGALDEHRTALTILHDWQKGKLRI